MKCILVIMLLSFCSLQANWEDHLRKCKNKKGNHTIAEIDFIYMLNLKERRDKWTTSLKQLEPFEIVPFRFNAINGWKMSEKAYKDVCESMVKIHYITRGQVGCLLSHISILKDAYNSGYNTIWVLEDDIEVLKDPRQISKLIQSLDELEDDWDILYTGLWKNFYGQAFTFKQVCDRPGIILKTKEYYLEQRKINDMFMEVHMRGAWNSVILRKSGIKKILDYLSAYGIYLPLDMELVYIPNFKQILLLDEIVSTMPGSPSDTSFELSESLEKTKKHHSNPFGLLKK